MKHSEMMARLERALEGARWRLFAQAAVQALVGCAAWGLPLTALAVAADQRWGGGAWTPTALGALGSVCLLVPLAFGAWRWATPLRSALAIDERAGLKDRISSAWEFLHSNQPLEEAHRVQLADALTRLEGLSMAPLFRPHLPRRAYVVPVFAVLLGLSFLVPPYGGDGPAQAAVDLQKTGQLAELRALQEELHDMAGEDEELAEIVRKLKDIEAQFEAESMGERDVMLELARLDEQVQQRMAALGAAGLERELNTVAPQLMASEATRPAAEAIKGNDLQDAAEKLEELGEEVALGKLDPEAMKHAATTMGVTASKLGEKNEGSFGGDFKRAGEALEKSDANGFKSAAKRIGDKLRQVDQYKKLNAMQKNIALSKATLGQPKECGACEGAGCATCNGTGLRPSGLKAGTGATDRPLGNPNRLENAFRQMLQVAGTAGDGPVDSQVEVTEGQTTPSALATQDVFAEYEAVAEEAIEREAIPLSHRYHVKRYFQAIRPGE